MKNLKDYLKYYWLETEYLEKEACSFFKKKHYLTAQQFFSIIEWKNPKFGKTKFSYLKPKNIKKLFGDIFKAQSDERRLEILLMKKGIKLATASAILTILYPKNFTVYDVRVRNELKKLKLWNEKPDDITNQKDVVKKYFEKYLPLIRKLAKKTNLTLRDCDRALWAKSWHKGLEKFITK